MGLFDQFPYTNFHNLNLDWIIGQIKSIKSAVTSTAEDAASASHSAEAAAASAGSAAGSAAYAGNAAALVQQVRDDLDTVNTEMTNFIQAHSGLYNETVLWSGTASATGDTITLSDDIRNYKYIDVQATYKGAVSASAFGTFSSNVVRFTPKMFTDDNAVLNIPYAYNDQLQICTVFMFWDSLDPTDYTKISLGYSRRVSINDHGDLDNAADPGTVIVKIVGVKNIADAEVIDARVGEDDTVYSTLKQRLDTEYSDLKSAIESKEAIPRDVKIAMDALFSKMGVKDDGEYASMYGVIHSWAISVNPVSISAVFEQGNHVVLSDDSLDSLKEYLTVTVLYDDGTTGNVSTYTLSGELTTGTNTITVTYLDKTATFTVNVTESVDITPALSSFLATAGATITVVENGISVSTTNGDYKAAYVKIPLKKNYTYRFKFDVETTNGFITVQLRRGFMTTSDKILVNVKPSSESGTSFIKDVIPSDSANWNDSTSPSDSYAVFYIAGPTKITTTVIYSNIKIIEYMAGGN